MTYRAVFLGLFGALFYLFFAVFPTRSPLDRRIPWLKWVALMLGASIALPGLHVGDVRAPAVLIRIVGQSVASIAVHLYIYLFFALGLVSLVGNSRRASTPEARRRIRVILWGTIIGVLPAAGERVAVDFWGFQPSFWIDVSCILIVFLFPLSFAYAVVKHRVLEIPALLKRSARYVLVQRGYIVVLFVVAAAAIALFTHTISRFFPADANIGMALSAVFGVVLVWASAPMVKRGTERIDRAFFRSAYDARVILQDLAEKTRTVTDRRELATLLENHIKGALHPKSLLVTWKPEMETSSRNADQRPESSTQFQPHYLGRSSLCALAHSSFPKSWIQFLPRCRCSGRSRSAEKPGTCHKVPMRQATWGRSRRNAWCRFPAATAD